MNEKEINDLIKSKVIERTGRDSFLIIYRKQKMIFNLTQLDEFLIDLKAIKNNSKGFELLAR